MSQISYRFSDFEYIQFKQDTRIKQKRTFDEDISCVQLNYFIQLISSSRQRGSQDRGQGQREEGRAVQEVPGGAQDRPHGVHQGQRASVPRPHPLRVHGLGGCGVQLVL